MEIIPSQEYIQYHALDRIFLHFKLSHHIFVKKKKKEREKKECFCGKINPIDIRKNKNKNKNKNKKNTRRKWLNIGLKNG